MADTFSARVVWRGVELARQWARAGITSGITASDPIEGIDYFLERPETLPARFAGLYRGLDSQDATHSPLFSGLTRFGRYLPAVPDGSDRGESLRPLPFDPMVGSRRCEKRHVGGQGSPRRELALTKLEEGGPGTGLAARTLRRRAGGGSPQCRPPTH